jgi:hypothetical protein
MSRYGDGRKAIDLERTYNVFETRHQLMDGYSTYGQRFINIADDKQKGPVIFEKYAMAEAKRFSASYQTRLDGPPVYSRIAHEPTK